MKKILLTLFIAVLAVSGCSLSGNKQAKTLNPEEAKARAESFINDYLMDSGTASITSIENHGDLYRIMVNIGGGEDIESFISKDGESFYPQVLRLADFESENEAPVAPMAVDVPKSEKPVVELFVMSFCPYGLQMQKGMLPVVKTLGEMIDFQMKFCDYAMQGEREIKEQLNQYCVEKQGKSNLVVYLDCFLKSGESDACMTSSGVDKQALAACISATDQEFSIMANLEDRSTYRGNYPSFNIHKADVDKYQVGGSPSLIINGAEVSSARDSASLLRTVCSAFIEAPEVCDAQLSSVTPSPGFGEGTGAPTEAGCE
jgi:hypothetical protein